METLNNCPICNNDLFIDAIKCIDNSISKETFQIVECTDCNFHFTNPRPDKEGIGKYYESEDYISHSDMAGQSESGSWTNGDKWIMAAEGVWPEHEMFHDDFSKMAKMSQEQRFQDFGFPEN